MPPTSCAASLSPATLIATWSPPSSAARADLLTHRDETSNWSDAWRERYITEHWHDYADHQSPVILRDKALALEGQLRSGYFRDRARRVAAAIGLTREQVADLELMYQREAQEPLKQYTLVMEKKKKAMEQPA